MKASPLHRKDNASAAQWRCHYGAKANEGIKHDDYATMRVASIATIIPNQANPFGDVMLLLILSIIFDKKHPFLSNIIDKTLPNRVRNTNFAEEGLHSAI